MSGGWHAGGGVADAQKLLTGARKARVGRLPQCGTPDAHACSMVRLSITLSSSSPRGAEDLVEGLQFQVPRTRLEPGCVRCIAWLDPDSAVQYIEDWATEADFRRRALSDNFTLLLAVVESAKDSSVQFDFVTQTRGLDYVMELRGLSPEIPPPNPAAEPKQSRRP